MSQLPKEWIEVAELGCKKYWEDANATPSKSNGGISKYIAEALWSLLSEGGGEFPKADYAAWWKDVVAEGYGQPTRDQCAKWAWNRAQAEVAIHRTRRFEILESANKWAARAAELEEENASLKDQAGIANPYLVKDRLIKKLEAKLKEKDKEIQGLEAKLRGGGSEPQRYNSVDGSMDSDGSLVSLEDYQALEARLAEKTKALEAAYDDYIQNNSCSGSWDMDGNLVEHSGDCLKCVMEKALGKGKSK